MKNSIRKLTATAAAILMMVPAASVGAEAAAVDAVGTDAAIVTEAPAVTEEAIVTEAPAATEKAAATEEAVATEAPAAASQNNFTMPAIILGALVVIVVIALIAKRSKKKSAGDAQDTDDTASTGDSSAASEPEAPAPEQTPAQEDAAPEIPPVEPIVIRGAAPAAGEPVSAPAPQQPAAPVAASADATQEETKDRIVDLSTPASAIRDLRSASANEENGVFRCILYRKPATDTENEVTVSLWYSVSGHRIHVSSMAEEFDIPQSLMKINCTVGELLQSVNDRVPGLIVEAALKMPLIIDMTRPLGGTSIATNLARPPRGNAPQPNPMSLTIEFQRTDAPNNHVYLMGRTNNGLNTMEIWDLKGRSLAGQDWVPGNVCCALFALTDEEYAWKDDGLDKLDELADKLMAAVPKDRMLGACYRDVKNNAQQTPSRLMPKNETMDGFAFPLWRQKSITENARKQLDEAGDIYVVYSTSMDERFPTIDHNGFAWVFTDMQYARAHVEKNPDRNLAIRAFDREGFYEYVRSIWYPNGILRFRLNMGWEGHYCEVNRDDLITDVPCKAWQYNGSQLNFIIARYRQNQAIDDTNASKDASTYWSILAHQLPIQFFLMPVNYEGEEDGAPVEDHTVRMTRGASALLGAMKAAAEKARESGRKIADPELHFFGDDGYEFTEETEERRIRVPIMSNGGTRNFAPAFTDFATFNRVFNGKSHIQLWTYDELRTLSGKVNGIVVNPGGVNLELAAEDMAGIEAERRQPLRMQRQPAAPAAPAAEAPKNDDNANA